MQSDPITARDITEDRLLDISKAVVRFVREHTNDISTAKAILSAASAAFGGGFTRDVQARTEAYLSLSELPEAPARSPGGA